VYPIKALKDRKTAIKIGNFLVGPKTFDHVWYPGEKTLVKKAVIESLEGKNHQYWYIEDNRMIIGAIGIRENKCKNGGYEMDADYIAVHKDYRRQGIANRLLKTAEKYVIKNKGRYIHILTCDIEPYKPANYFYQSNNYKKVAEMPDYYNKGEGRIDYYKTL
jgi:ribosomal protein S18 acetylase RimI-like enzyme